MKIREPTLQDNIAKNYTNNNTKLQYINKKNGIDSLKINRFYTILLSHTAETNTYYKDK